MGHKRALLVVIVGVLVVGSAVAQETKSRFEEHNTLIRDKGTIAPLDGAAFGDSISYYAGGLTFTQTDTSIPGNNALPVAITRQYSVTGHRHPYANLPFGDWDIVLPNIGGVYAVETGWVLASQGGPTTNRCNVPPYNSGDPDPLARARPPSAGISSGTITPFTPLDYWNGVQVDFGSGPQDLLLNEQAPPKQPAGGPWRWISGDTFVKCLSAVQNDAGEGFLAIDGQGTTYRFDWMAATLETSLRSPACDPWGACHGSQLDRKHYRLYATRVEDRFGNYVEYTYANAPAEPVKLTAITSSDGRSISLTYSPQGNIQSVSENGRLWTYTYDYSNGVTLTGVTRPDATSWQFDFDELSSLLLQAKPNPPGELLTCMVVREVLDADVVVTGTVTHPSGLVGEFKVKPTLFGRTAVPFYCSDYGDPYWEPNHGDPIYPMRWWAPAVISKKTYGPGLPTEQWSYEYDSDFWFNMDPNVLPQDATTGTTRIEVHGPDGGWTRYTFGNGWLKDEGLLLKTEIGTGPSNILRVEESEYVTDPDETPGFNYLVGTGIDPFNGSFASEARRPRTSHVILQDGVEFTSTVTVFDVWARPLSVTKSSVGNFQGDDSLVEVTTYYDDESATINPWVRDVVESIAVDGKTVVSRTFHPSSALPMTEHRFGWLRDTLTWSPDGTLLTVKDGLNRITTLSSWKRGIPRMIGYPDGSGTSASVNDRGEITSITNELGDTHHYEYDDLGRLTRIEYPADGQTTWAPTTYSLTRGGFAEVGISSDHWRYTETTGDFRKVTFLDARFRPILTHEYDALDWEGTDTFVKRTFDHENRETFISYPDGNGLQFAGVHKRYDVLGRLTGTTQHSELGPLVTSISYLDQFRTLETDARGNQRITHFQTFDTPDTSQPVRIESPEGQTTVIDRDVFGKPTRIARGQVERHFVYDANERLCQRIDPESGATVMAYDLAGNIAWTASGFPSAPGQCPRGSVAEAVKSIFEYDDRNRATIVDHPGSDVDIQFSYFANGALKTAHTVATHWSYEYNKRGLLTKEILNQAGLIYTFGKAYDEAGTLQAESYPGDLIIEYATDARGRPTRAGGFATGAQYHANGALAKFTFGNGAVRTMNANSRGLPSRVSDIHSGVGIHDWGYAYDENGNLTAIYDYDTGQGGKQSRQMFYDGLDRLDIAIAPNLWGTASYAYDASDNVTALAVQSGPHARSYDYVYDANNRLASISEAGGVAHSFGYDARGNQVTRTSGVSSQTRAFDHANRLTSISGIASYLYDGHGRRSAVHRQDGSTQENIYTLDGRLRMQRDESADTAEKYIYLGSTLVARLSGPALPPTDAPVLTVPGTSLTGDYSVSWSGVDGASDYRWQEGGGEWISTTSLAVDFDDRPNGVYEYRVRACNSAGCGPASAPASVHVMLAPASSPALNDPPDNYTGSYTFNWSPVLTANRYILKRYDGTSWSTIHDSPERTKAESVPNAGTYAYQLEACHYQACAPATAAVSVTVFQPPTPSLSAPSSNYTGNFGVSWPSSPGATYYVLEQKLGSSGWSTVYDGGGTSTTIYVSTTGTYSYRIASCNASLGCGPVSSAVQVVASTPPTPTLTTPSGTQTSSFTVSWGPSYGATSYQLQRNKNGSSWATILNSGGNSLGQSGLSSGDYGYRVLACGALGCSSYSQPRIVTVVSPPTASPTVSVPSGIVYYPTPGSFTVSWTTISGATSYQLQQRKNSGSWSTVYNSSGTSTVRSGNTGHYEYRARACNAAGCGPWSAIKSVYVQQMGGCPPVGPCDDPY